MSTTCRYCLKQFTRPDNRKRHENTHLVENEREHFLNQQVIPSRQAEPLSLTLEPPSPAETTETVEPVESVEPTDLESPRVHINPKTGKKFMYDAFGDPMSPDSLKPLDVFPESPTSPVKMEDEVSDMDPWDEFRKRVKALKLKDFNHVMKTLRKAGNGKKLAQIRAYNQMLPELQKALRQVYIDHLKWVHVLREDPIHKAILETRKKFQEEEDMDFNEAVEAAVNQRKYLLNRVFQPMEEPDTDEEDMDEDDEEDEDESPDEDNMDADDEEDEDEDESPDESPDERSPEEGNERPRYDPFGIPPSFTQPL